VPNYYFLSFRPQSLQLGLHALELRVKDRPDYKVNARKGYWVNAGVEHRRSNLSHAIYLKVHSSVPEDAYGFIRSQLCPRKPAEVFR
jgi:hypothetical protein